MVEQTKRTPVPPTRLSDQDYTRAVAGHLKEFEGLVPRIYTDGKGIPTMGAGVALAVSSDGGKTYTLRDLGQIGAEISGDPAKPYLFSDAEKKLLTDTVSKLNDPKLGEKAAAAEAQKLIPPYAPGTETAADNKFGFTLSDARIVAQAQASWDEHRTRAFNAVRAEAKKKGWSQQEIARYVDSLKGSEQEVALTSLAYNSVKAPKAIGALLDGDPVTARKEILYRSNGDQSTGHARRRRVEADLLAGKPTSWSEPQQSDWKSYDDGTEATTYRSTYPRAFPDYPPPVHTPPPETPPQPGPAGSAAAPAAPQDKGALLTPEEAARQNMPFGEYLAKSVSQREASGGPALVNGPQVASASPELDQRIMAEYQAMAENPAAPADPQVAAMVAMAGTPEANPGKAAMLKPAEKLTESEMQSLINHAQGDYRGWRSGDPLKYHAYEKVQDWHVGIYGDGPQQTDGGKPLAPQPIRPIPERPSPHVTPQGGDLWQATARIGQQLADAAGADGYANAVTGLQRGLNMLNQANPLPKRSPAYGPYTTLAPVTEDGKYGPQTDFALKHATARLGPGKVEEGLALGRFNTFARDARRNGNPDGLEAKTHSLFGPLFRGAGDDTSPKVEAGVLQETLNDLGRRKRDDWTPLKVDNRIGPKTTQAFGAVLADEDADTLTRSFGRGLGLL